MYVLLLPKYVSDPVTGQSVVNTIQKFDGTVYKLRLQCQSHLTVKLALSILPSPAANRQDCDLELALPGSRRGEPISVRGRSAHIPPAALGTASGGEGRPALLCLSSGHVRAIGLVF